MEENILVFAGTKIIYPDGAELDLRKIKKPFLLYRFPDGVDTNHHTFDVNTSHNIAGP